MALFRKAHGTSACSWNDAWMARFVVQFLLFASALTSRLRHRRPGSQVQQSRLVNYHA